MTVRELIEELKKQNQDELVVIYGKEDWFGHLLYTTVDYVEPNHVVDF